MRWVRPHSSPSSVDPTNFRISSYKNNEFFPLLHNLEGEKNTTTTTTWEQLLHMALGKGEQRFSGILLSYLKELCHREAVSMGVLNTLQKDISVPRSSFWHPILEAMHLLCTVLWLVMDSGTPMEDSREVSLASYYIWIIFPPYYILW